MKYKLKDIADITMGQSPKGKSYNNKNEGKAFLQGRKTFGRMYPTIDTWTTEPKKIAKSGSVLMSVRAPVGDINIANDEICIGRGLCSINAKNGNNRYLYYLLLYNKANIIKKSSGTVFDSINKEQLEETVLNVHKDKEQSKIVSILNNIDEKIELNSHTNNNLQDFLLSQYKLYFDNKETNGKLKDIVKKMNRTIKRDKINKLLKYYPIDILPKNNIILQEGKDIEEAQSSLIEFNSNEILVGAMRIYFHRVCISNNAGITRNTTFVLTPKQEEYLYYALLTIYQDSFIEYASLTSKGTTMPYAVWENVCSEFNIYIPTKEELKEFNVICKAIINKMNINQEQNNKLEKIRDTLLPKLMNGEIDLDKIEI